MASFALTTYETKGGTRWRLTGRTGAGQFSRSYLDEEAARQAQATLDLLGAVKGLAFLDADDDPREEVKPDRTVRSVVSEAIRLRTALKQGTRDGYVQLAEDWIYPFLGDRPIDRIQKDDIREWVNTLQAKGLSHNSIRNRHRLLSSCFEWAVENRYMPENPAKRVKLPEGGGIDMCILEPEEIEQLLQVIDPFYRDFIVVLIGTGMRWGEATALTTNDITIRPHQVSIRVNKGWERIRKGPARVGVGKTKQARRTINVPHGTPAYDALVRQMARERTVPYLFTSQKGYILRPCNFAQTAWHPARRRLIREYGWTKCPRVHDLRHTAASLMLGNGASISAVQHILGHALPSTTLNYYGHLLKDGEQNALRALGNAMQGRSRQIA